MTLVRALITMVIIVVLTGCTAGGAANVKKLSDGNRILVISSVGNTYNAVNIGVIAFSNAWKEFDVSSWAVDKYLERETSKYLTKSRFKPVFSQEMVEQLQITDNSWTGGLNFDGTEVKIQDLAKSARADTLLFLHQMNRGDPFFKTNQKIKGYGYYQRNLPYDIKSINYAYIGMTLYDVNSMKKIAGRARWNSTEARDSIAYQGLSAINDKSVSEEEEIIKELLLKNVEELLGILEIK